MQKSVVKLVLSLFGHFHSISATLQGFAKTRPDEEQGADPKADEVPARSDWFRASGFGLAAHQVDDGDVDCE